MKRVLILSSKSPYPLQDGAAIRTYQSIRVLAELGYFVDVVYLSESDDYETVKKGLGDHCQNLVHFTLTKKQSYLKVLKGLFFNKYPLQVNYFYSQKMKRWIDSNVDSYDIIYCNNIRTALYAKDVKKKKVLDFVDAYSMNYQAARERTTGLWHWIYTIDFPRCERFEQEQLHVFDKCLIISQIDKDYILSYSKKQADIAVIENYTAIDAAKRVVVNKEKHQLVFVGAMNYEPNISAVRFFCSQVMPSLIKRYPDIRFYIVGKTPSTKVLALADEHTIVTGFVDSIWEYLKDASIVVTPMQSGSGLQNKILQALAVGACVVTTPKGFEGLIRDEGQPYVVRNSTEMVETISHLLDHPEERMQRVEASIQYVKKHYDIEVIKQKFSELLTSI